MYGFQSSLYLVAKPVQDTLKTLKWETVPHPPFSSDIAKSDYDLFRSTTDLTDLDFANLKKKMKK